MKYAAHLYDPKSGRRTIKRWESEPCSEECFVGREFCPDDHEVFMWTDGNYSCDCNRRIFMGTDYDDDRCTHGEIILERLVNETTGTDLTTKPLWESA